MNKRCIKVLFLISISFLSFTNIRAQPVIEICMVTVDTPTNYNYIVWERPISGLIDSYFIYKETTKANVYMKIGSVPYNDLSVFIDSNSNPAKSSDRYKISLLKSNGKESPLSSPHKTMHVTASQGTSGENNLIWSHYQGYSFSSYYIYRGTNADNLQVLDSIQSNMNSYTDLAPPPGVVYYRVTIAKLDTCAPAVLRGITASGPYSQSLSNLKDYNINDPEYLTVSPTFITLSGDSSSSVSIDVFTNLSTWNAESDTSWLTINMDIPGTIVATAEKNPSTNLRNASILVSGLGVDNQIITIFQNGATGITKIFQNKHLNIYPNPFNNTTDIYLPDNENFINRLEVLDIHGKVMKVMENLHGNKITLSSAGLTKGMYLVKLTGNSIYIDKVIVE